MNAKFKTLLAEIVGSSESTLFSNTLPTDTNFLVKNFIEKRIIVEYADIETFELENIIASLALDLADVSFIFIAAFTDPNSLGLSDTAEGVKFDLYLEEDSSIPMGKTSQFILSNIEELEYDFTINKLYPNQEFPTFIEIIIGTR